MDKQENFSFLHIIFFYKKVIEKRKINKKKWDKYSMCKNKKKYYIEVNI